MYNEKFFEEQLSLTSQQAADYISAYWRIRWLLMDYRIFKNSKKQYPTYCEISFQIVKKLHRVESEAQCFYLLEETFVEHIKLRKAIIKDLAKRLLSIKDVFIWPAEAYD